MLNPNRRRVQRDPVVDGGNDGALVSPAENGPVRAVGVAGAKGLAVLEKLIA